MEINKIMSVAVTLSFLAVGAYPVSGLCATRAEKERAKQAYIEARFNQIKNEFEASSNYLNALRMGRVTREAYLTAMNGHPSRLEHSRKVQDAEKQLESTYGNERICLVRSDFSTKHTRKQKLETRVFDRIHTEGISYDKRAVDSIFASFTVFSNRIQNQQLEQLEEALRHFKNLRQQAHEKFGPDNPALTYFDQIIQVMEPNVMQIRGTVALQNALAQSPSIGQTPVILPEAYSAYLENLGTERYGPMVIELAEKFGLQLEPSAPSLPVQ